MDEERSDNENPIPVPSNQQPLLPSFQVQIPMPGQQQRTNVQVLAETIKESTKEGNSSESQVTLQIILIASAILAIVGGFTLGSNINHFGLLAVILLMFTITGLGGSLFAGVSHFITERHFWYNNRQKGIDAYNLILTMENNLEKERAAYQALGGFNEGSSRIAFWIQIITFVIGVLSLLIFIAISLVTRV